VTTGGFTGDLVEQRHNILVRGCWTLGVVGIVACNELLRRQ
jgi:hypothetical protein